MLAFEEAVDAQEAIAQLVAEDATLYERPRLARATLEDDPAELAAKQRQTLGITEERQLKWRDAGQAYRELRAAVEKRGIFTFEKDMPTSDCRGFSVFEPSSIPIIVVNKGELYPQPKAFTLLHEYAHLLLRDSGLCDENRKNRIERFCNRFSASFLMPSALVQKIVRAYMIQGREVDRALVKDAAKRLRVSQQSMALRLEELRYAPRGFYEAWLSESKPEDLSPEQAQPSDKKPIVTWERRKISELGKRYLSLVVDALQHRVVSRPEAFAMMGRGMSSDVFAKVRELIR
jgi:Zn-dependent peptidase ImmA (M78 family)